MNYFKRLLPPGSTVHSPEQNQAQMFLMRLESSTLPEDRKRALQELKNHTKQYPHIQLHSAAQTQLMKLLQDNSASNIASSSSSDLDEGREIQRDVLEILLSVMQNKDEENKSESPFPSSSASSSPSVSLGVTPSMMNIATFVQHSSNITLVLDVMNDGDLYVRYFCIQLMTVLLMARAEKVQSVVLNYPNGINQLLLLLSDRREIIRNEILLLLEALTHGNSDIQKIVAFNGVFDRLLGIVKEEGGFGV